MPPKRKREGASAAVESKVDEADLANVDDNDPATPNGSVQKPTTTSPRRSAQSHKRRASKPVPTTDKVQGTIVQKAELVKASEDAEELRMEGPPKAGLVDPAGGYKTNPPPEDRVVRVYADGVFDLFHLGYVRPQRAVRLPRRTG